MLTSIHTFDAAAGCDALTFQPCSDRALSNHKVYVDSFRSIYSVNSGIAPNAAVATGRYPEDSYYGGNPWYLTTLAAAEQLYDALTVWDAQGSLNVTNVSVAFFQQFAPTVTAGTYPASSTTYGTLTAAIRAYADGFVAVVAKYTPSNGGLAEQYTRAGGTPISAADLTWSYAAALTAFSAREGFTPESWGAKGLSAPASCNTNSGGGGGGGSGNTVAVTFNVQATTVWGGKPIALDIFNGTDKFPVENIYLTGSVDALQNWSPDNALLLSSANYPTWSSASHTVVDFSHKNLTIRT